ncbi:hypothetical protein DICPUDRAFT_99242 [Dictyostelium purpureum]|uniref:Uncharacterized protein n=1 Tax=Dictyostelium purpureum TaxID=5786 RepID=F0ZXK6_DICPU|nr:uncharacterized protein DICPUDRAFT_99242 [Dictyostelium purpureum]EGC31341.1 hypothetical protein DICPUDRAFT_99242 [Dictyostelium purpureum]|eukprot:XP_003292150.1 hypothetical protein DICPUDRAFT_99242 [Dictyostelium purpureum]
MRFNLSRKRTNTIPPATLPRNQDQIVHEEEEEASSQNDNNNNENDLMTVEEFILGLNQMDPSNSGNNSIKVSSEDDEIENENHLMTVEEFILSCREKNTTNNNRSNNGSRRGSNSSAAVVPHNEQDASPSSLSSFSLQKRQHAIEHQDQVGQEDDGEELLTVEEFIKISEKRDNSNDMLTIEEFIIQSNNGKLYHRSNLIY